MTDAILIVQSILLVGVLVWLFPIGREKWVDWMEYRYYLRYEQSPRTKKEDG